MAITAAKRRSLNPSQFALPGRGEGPGGKGAGSYPIDTKARARNALARVAQHGTPAEQATVRRKVAAKWPSINVSGKPKRSS